MAIPPRYSTGRAIPSGRLSRLARFGGMAAGIGAGMVAEGARRLADGERPRLDDLILTPANARRVTDQLANLRGAAMKLGQMLSLDAGDFLPRELSDILARLRAEAQHMPASQLLTVLDRHWGKGWRLRFQRFEARPFAAASIGQVHRATLPDGTRLAVKVQYPGVKASIDSDVDNVATLLRVSRLLPPALDITPLLAEAKQQLHDEADYAREGRYLQRFAALLAGDEDFIVPALNTELSGADVLAMSFVEGRPIESLIDAPQAVRDRVVRLLCELTLRELFDYRVMQTDPNFANYRYQPGVTEDAPGRIVLLDFGAARDVPQALSDGYRRLFAAALTGDVDAVREAALANGMIGTAAATRHRDAVDAMIAGAIAPFAAGSFDFGAPEFVAAMRERGLTIAADRAAWHTPAADLLFIQRKLGGIYLLASRLKARVDVRALLERHVRAVDAIALSRDMRQRGSVR